MTARGVDVAAIRAALDAASDDHDHGAYSYSFHEGCSACEGNNAVRIGAYTWLGQLLAALSAAEALSDDLVGQLRTARNSRDAALAENERLRAALERWAKAKRHPTHKGLIAAQDELYALADTAAPQEASDA